MKTSRLTMPRRSPEFGLFINRVWHPATRLRQIVPDHDLGGFLVVADFDEPPGTMEFLPVVGLVHYEENDDGDVVTCGIGLYTMAKDGHLEVWDTMQPVGDEYLGITPTIDVEVRDHFTALARERLQALRARSRQAEHVAIESFGGPVS